MLAEALKVIEAARALDPYPGRAGIYRIACEPRFIPVRLRELAEAIETFDRAVSKGRDAEALVGQVLRYAARKGIDVGEMVAELGAGDALTDEALAELIPQPGEVGAPDDIRDVSTSRQANAEGDVFADRNERPSERHSPDKLFPGTPREVERKVSDTTRPMDVTVDRRKAPVPDDAPDPEPLKPAPSNQLHRMKDLERRMETLAASAGWTPALQKIDAAWRKAVQAMKEDDSPEGMAYLMTGDAERLMADVEAEIEAAERESLDEAPRPAF